MWLNIGRDQMLRIKRKGMPRSLVMQDFPLTSMARMRSNDGAVDTQGRFWVEAFDDPTIVELKEEGVLFRLDHDGTLHTMYENMTIPNGITWNEKDSTM